MCTVRDFDATLDLTPDGEIIHIIDTVVIEYNNITSIAMFYNICSSKSYSNNISLVLNKKRKLYLLMNRLKHMSKRNKVY